jgi:hypothetical protein
VHCYASDKSCAQWYGTNKRLLFLCRSVPSTERHHHHSRSAVIIHIGYCTFPNIKLYQGLVFAVLPLVTCTHFLIPALNTTVNKMIARIFLALLAFRGSDASPLGGTLRRSLRAERRLDIFDKNDPMSSPSLRTSSHIDSIFGRIARPEVQCETTENIYWYVVILSFLNVFFLNCRSTNNNSHFIYIQ